MKEKLSLHLETVDKINKKIYRMGFESQTLLVILSIMLILWMVMFAVFGFYNFVFAVILVFGFLRFSKYMKSEVEKGNLHPIDEYIDSYSKPSYIYDDDAISQLIVKQKNKFNEAKQSTSY